MAIPILPVAAAATMFNVAATIQKNKNQRTVLQAQANEFRFQSVLVDQAADLELAQLKRAQRYRQGAITAAFGASGVRVDEGSALEVALDQARADATEQINIRATRGIQSRQLRGNAQLSEFQARLLKKNLPIDAVGAGLSTAAPFVLFG